MARKNITPAIAYLRTSSIDARPGFAAMLERIAGNGVRTIIVETANRFARDLMVQEVGHARLKERGIELIAADNPSSFIDDTPTAVLVCQMLGAIAQFDKAMTVSKLRGARERKRRDTGKCEGRKPLAEQFLEAVKLAKRLRRASPKTGERMSLRKISAELATAGHVNERGAPFNAKSILAMIEGPMPEKCENYLAGDVRNSGPMEGREPRLGPYLTG